MSKPAKRRRYKKFLIIAASIVAFIIIFFIVFVNRFLEPMLKDRLHTLIVQGSDSLYTYTLGKLNADFFGGDVEVENLQIRIDSNRYEYLKSKNALPSLTMQLSLGSGHIRGIGIFALLFNKEVKIREIMSKDANLKLSRHARKKDVEVSNHVPLWKAMEPKIKGVSIDKIRLEGIKMNYKNADTSELKLEFEDCDASFDDIRIDSAAAFDTSRIGFTKSISLRFEEIKFRTKDSIYKLKIDSMSYSSVSRKLEIRNFKFQPTLKRDEFYKNKTLQQTMYTIKFDKIVLTNLYLDHFIRTNRLDADSAYLDSADVKIYTDKNLLPEFDSKIGKYPHQQLLKAPTIINIKKIVATNGSIEYREKDNTTMGEGFLTLGQLHLVVNNVTNDSDLVKAHPMMTANAAGTILGGSPFAIDLKFYMDSTNGRYDAKGSVKNITASQMNVLAVPLANVKINSGNIQNVDFEVSGEDYSAVANVRMRYNNLAVTINKTDEETGETTARKFITQLLNKYIMWPSNPGPDGVERVANQSKVARLTTQTFFSMLWKGIFAGMQDIMIKTGRMN